MSSPTSRNSATPKPRVVPAGEPSLIARGDRGLLRIERDAVLVAGDVGAAERRLRHLAGEALRPQVDQHQMGVGAAGDDVAAARLQGLGKHLGVLDDISGISAERGLQRLAERHRLRRDHMHQRSALQAREHRRVDLLGEVFLVGQDHAAARTAQGLVGGRRHHMGMGERARMRAAGDQAGEVRHVDQQERADLVGDLAEPP